MPSTMKQVFEQQDMPSLADLIFPKKLPKLTLVKSVKINSEGTETNKDSFRTDEQLRVGYKNNAKDDSYITISEEDLFPEESSSDLFKDAIKDELETDDLLKGLSDIENNSTLDTSTEENNSPSAGDASKLPSKLKMGVFGQPVPRRISAVLSSGRKGWIRIVNKGSTLGKLSVNKTAGGTDGASNKCRSPPAPARLKYCYPAGKNIVIGYRVNAALSDHTAYVKAPIGVIRSTLSEKSEERASINVSSLGHEPPFKSNENRDAFALVANSSNKDGSTVPEFARSSEQVLELVENTSNGEHLLDTVTEKNLIALRAVCEQCGHAISHHIVGLLVRRDGSEYGYRCRVCQTVLTDASDMAAHMDSHSANAGEARCRFCAKSLEVFQKSTNEAYRCLTCNTLFGNRQSLMKHRQLHRPKERFPCEVCHKSFTVKHQLAVHVRSHYGLKPYACDLCPATFVQPSHLTNHRRTHTGERPFKCELCSRAFVQQAHLVAHRRTHTGERPFVCDMPNCNKSFRQSGQLASHRKRHLMWGGEVGLGRRRANPLVTPKKEEYTCKICKKELRTPMLLKRHMLSHADGTKSCKVCHKVFTRLDHLKRHMALHRGSLSGKSDQEQKLPHNDGTRPRTGLKAEVKPDPDVTSIGGDSLISLDGSFSSDASQNSCFDELKELMGIDNLDDEDFIPQLDDAKLEACLKDPIDLWSDDVLGNVGHGIDELETKTAVRNLEEIVDQQDFSLSFFSNDDDPMLLESDKEDDKSDLKLNDPSSTSSMQCKWSKGPKVLIKQ